MSPLLVIVTFLLLLLFAAFMAFIAFMAFFAVAENTTVNFFSSVVMVVAIAGLGRGTELGSGDGVVERLSQHGYGYADVAVAVAAAAAAAERT